MVKSESAIGGPAKHLSWADEVEQEEEAQYQLQQQKRPNPFGSARPREVVLQEKGIDWRKLDIHLHQTSLLRRDPLNEKSCKENIPASAFTVTNRVHSGPASKCPKQKQKAADLGFNLLATPNQMPPIVLPPLRYPPRIYGSNLNPEKKNVGGLQKVQRSHNLKHESIEQFECLDQIVYVRQGRQLRKNSRYFRPGQASEEGNNLRKPATPSNVQCLDSNPPIRKFERDAMVSLLGKPPRQDTICLSPHVRNQKKESHSSRQKRWNCLTTQEGTTSGYDICAGRSVDEKKCQTIRCDVTEQLRKSHGRSCSRQG